MSQGRTSVILIRNNAHPGGMTAVPEPTDYDTIAERYSEKIDERPWNALYERPTTLALLPEVDKTDVLDAGCGHGWYAEWLVRHGARVVAIALAQRWQAPRYAGMAKMPRISLPPTLTKLRRTSRSSGQMNVNAPVGHRMVLP